MNVLLKSDIYLKMLHANSMVPRNELNTVRESFPMSGMTSSESTPSNRELHLCLQHLECGAVLSLKGKKNSYQG